MDDSWKLRAACRNTTVDPNDFLDGDDETQERLIAIYCGGCPVAHPCLEVGLSGPSSYDQGVWGGTTREVRRRLRRERRKKQQQASSQPETF